MELCNAQHFEMRVDYDYEEQIFRSFALESRKNARPERSVWAKWVKAKGGYRHSKGKQQNKDICDHNHSRHAIEKAVIT